ncbi:MAG TPA: zf-HC2 domain-containing protein, partial [Elusimicrobiales bacterium]|nr:zf-HC2 domain-containing protein [Elusimicrobiales bacterium]
MEHDKFKENLSAYMDGELKGGELAALEAHLAACPDCARELAGLRQVSAIFKKHAPEAVPHPLKEAVFNGLEKPAASTWLKPAVVFATAAAALLVVFALPKFRGDRAVFSPNLFQNSYYEESAMSAGFGARVGGPDTLQTAAPASAEGLAADTAPEPEKKDAAPRYAMPAFSKAGAFGQAKMARSAAGAARGAPAAKKEVLGGVFASLAG